MTQALSGVTVADFSHVMAGPYASHLLRLMGATVIKIESPDGDNFRNYGGDPRFEGMSPAFIAANAGKKSIALDLKRSEDLDIAKRIVARSDVVLENFRPGVMARLGLSYEVAASLRPGVVYCSVSGYGQDGPRRDWPAIDNIVQATSGMMMLSGDEDSPPVRVGFPIVDTLTGQTAAIAILGALMRQWRSGEGAYIDVSMLDASLAFMTSALTPYLATGKGMPRRGNLGYSGLPTAAMFTAKDGREISLGVVQDNQFAALARYVGRVDWLDDARFATPAARRRNFDALTAELNVVMSTRDAADWEAGMSEAGIPCGMVRRVEEAAALAGDGALQTLPLDGQGPGGRVRIPGAGFRMKPGSPGVDTAPPRLDEHREEILRWIASEDGEIGP